MSKFKIGDKVRILPDPPRFTDDPGIVSKMKSYFGDIVTISSYRKHSSSYCIEEDGKKFI